MTVLRIPAVVVLMVLWTVLGLVTAQGYAADGTPLQWHTHAAWSAQVQPAGNDLLVLRFQPAWQTADPVLSVINVQGKVLQSAGKGSHFRAAVWNNGKIVAIRQIGQNNEVIVYSQSFRVLYRQILPVASATDIGEQPAVMSTGTVVVIKLGRQLYTIQPHAANPEVQLFEQNVIGFGPADGRWLFAAVHEVGGLAYVSVVDTAMRRRLTSHIPISSRAFVGTAADRVVVVQPVDDEHSSQVSIVDPYTSDVRTVSVPVRAECVTWYSSGGMLYLAAVRNNNGREYLAVATQEGLGGLLTSGLLLPPDNGPIEKITSFNDTLCILYPRSVVSVAHGRILSNNDVDLDLGPAALVQRTPHGLLLTTRVASALFVQESVPLWWFWRTVSTVGPYVIPGILLLVIILLAGRLRQQKRFLGAMLQVPGNGLVLVLDDAGRLLQTNEKAASLLRLSAKVPMGRLYLAYMRHSGVQVLQQFVTEALDARKPLSEKVSINDDDDLRDYMVTAQPLWGSFGRLRGMVITGIDISEELERRRLVNWAQLAHDMQTNLSTIRLNAEQMVGEFDGRPADRIRRILFQTEVLIQRVRDLVSVGRSEAIQRVPVHTAEFCTQLRHEFDPVMFPHVEFVMKLRGTMINIDRLKMSRAVRNAIENAIKSLRGKNGTVEISTWFDRSNVYFKVADTGVGMDTLTLENMMKPYYTTAKDGTGSGIGTMIMQHVTHLHGGSIRVTSEPGQGTQVVFRIPR